MARDDWFRRTTWSAADQEDFFARLKRSKTSTNKAQYLRIQAVHLAEAGLHAAALGLLDILFRDFPDRLELASAHLQKAEYLVVLGQPIAAIAEFRLSLQAEREFPNVRTSCWLQFPWFIVRQELAEHYDEAWSVLDEFQSAHRWTVPLDRYRYAAVRALIAASRQNEAAARDFATVALQLEAASFSGFRYHPTVGLVGKVDPEIHSRLAVLAGVSPVASSSVSSC
jgi:hypothetical protein